MSRISRFLRAVEQDESLSRALRHCEVLPARPAELARTLPSGYEALAPLLKAQGIAGLYGHQARAIEAWERGANVALATPTASGKTLVFNWPTLKGFLADPESTAIYLFPLKALEQDQRKRLEEDARELGAAGRELRIGIYDGDTPQSERRRMRERPPQVLITTPDMLHLGLLPHHESWRPLLRGLRCIVLDELHTYRGVFGSHMAQVLRRLLRVATHHGGAPRFIAASATIANPGELARALTGREFEVIEKDDSAKSERNVMLFRPHGSPYTAAAKLFRMSLDLGLRTIAFTKSRVATELMHTWIAEAAPELAPRISSYRAGFLPEERREIERRLFSGELAGVISTSALELGIDVGGLDVCILVGYPGSQIATWQRAGRVGRSDSAAIALVAQPDALDQYLVSHPKVLFERGFEPAVADAYSVEILAAHLPCAAAELPLEPREAWLAEPAVRNQVTALEARGALLQAEEGDRWFATQRLPHRAVSLRNAGSAFDISEDAPGSQRPRAIGTIGIGRVFAECFEGAIYLHMGRQYLVTRLDLESRNVHVRAVRSAFFTRALSEKETEILTRERARPVGSFQLSQGRVRVTTTVTGFERRHVHGQDLLSSETLSLPPTSFETTGIWIEMPDVIPDGLRADGRHPMGSIHAVEHASLSLFPLYALCDRFDVAGISQIRHPQLGRAAIFLYDAHPGGVGLVASLFDRVESLLESTLELIEHCECEEGCLGCVHSPRCGNGNRPIDKAGAQRALRWLLGREALPALAPSTETDHPPRTEAPMPQLEAQPTCRVTPPGPAPRLVFFDVETQRSAEEVGGWNNADQMGLAVAVVWDSARAEFTRYREAQVVSLLDHLSAADLVVGFNVRRFDYRVLAPYTRLDLASLPTFDVLDAIHRRLGFRISLDHLAQETLGTAKSADGLQALRWWKEGRIEEIEQYCEQDVALLRDLFDHAVAHGQLLFRTKAGERVRLPAPWRVASLIEAARAERAGTHEPGRRRSR